MPLTLPGRSIAEALTGCLLQIADFGMSRIMEKSADPTDTVTMGTVTHMPPELLMEGKLSPAADVYAFGALAWPPIGTLGRQLGPCCCLCALDREGHAGSAWTRAARTRSSCSWHVHSGRLMTVRQPVRAWPELDLSLVAAPVTSMQNDMSALHPSMS